MTDFNQKKLAAEQAAKLAARATYLTLMMGPKTATVEKAANVARNHILKNAIVEPYDGHPDSDKYDAVCNEIHELLKFNWLGLERANEILEFCKAKVEEKDRALGKVTRDDDEVFPAPMRMRF
jgi:hypothetical protein